MSFLGLAATSGDFGGETSTPDYMSPSGVVGIDNGPDLSGALSGSAPTPTDPGSGGTYLNEIATLIGATGTAVGNTFRGINTPQPIAIPRTTNVPSSSLQRLGLPATAGGSNLLIWLVVVVVGLFALKFIMKKG